RLPHHQARRPCIWPRRMGRGTYIGASDARTALACIGRLIALPSSIALQQQDGSSDAEPVLLRRREGQFAVPWFVDPGRSPGSLPLSELRATGTPRVRAKPTGDRTGAAS